MGTFQGVVTTGIYCLPSCSARPRPANVLAFSSVAGAEAAGFRACHRCRPYRGPPSPPTGASMLVCRGVDLIAAGALDEGDEAGLAARLGVSARHLRRMFTEQIGATPDRLARSRRAHFARRLLDDTDLPVSDVAFAAGFGSLRQFNRVMAATFRATPRALRERRRRADRLVADGGLALRVPLAGPVDLDRRLRELAQGAIPGIERRTAAHYRRTVTLGGDPGVIEIGAGYAADDLRLIVHLPRLQGLIHLVDRVRRLVTDGTGDPYETGVRAIVAGSVGDTAAPGVLGQIVARYGTRVAGLRPFGLSHLFPAPPILAAADLHSLGLDTSCARAIRDHATRADDARPEHTVGSGARKRTEPPDGLA